MIFRSRIRNLQYVVVPVHKSVVAGIVTHSEGLRVQFTGAKDGTFDSESPGAKASYASYAAAYSDSHPNDPVTPEIVQKRVEDYLLKHRDNGTLFHVMEDEAPVSQVLDTCIAAVEGAGVCGKPAQPGSDYCADCARELTHA